jgi:hypothetical protein
VDGLALRAAQRESIRWWRYGTSERYCRLRLANADLVMGHPAIGNRQSEINKGNWK